MIGEKLSDADHAIAVRKAASELVDSIRNAAADGVSVELEIALCTGTERSRDRITHFPGVHVKIARPL